MRKKINLNDIVVHNQEKRHLHKDIDEVVNKINEPKAEAKQLTDKDGLDRSYDADNDVSIIDNRVYIAGTKIGRASDWYDDIVKVPAL